MTNTRAFLITVAAMIVAALLTVAGLKVFHVDPTPTDTYTLDGLKAESEKVNAEYASRYPECVALSQAMKATTEENFRVFVASNKTRMDTCNTIANEYASHDKAAQLAYCKRAKNATYNKPVATLTPGLLDLINYCKAQLGCNGL